MSDDTPALKRAKRPAGVTILALFFYASAALVVISALATGEENIPSDISALITIYLVILAWGLWKLYRWAWFASIIMFFISIIYMLSYGSSINEALFSVPIGVPIVFSLLWIFYLLRDKVRKVYLANGWFPLEEVNG